MILGITGHRSGKMGGFKIPNPTYNFVMDETQKNILELKPEKIITGLAIGFDTWVAELCIKLNIPFIAATPFIGQERFWPQETQQYYHKLLEHANTIEVVSPGGFASWKMQARNQWIVNNSDMMLAAFDSSQKGGTANCVAYAIEQKKQLITIDPRKALNA